MAAAVTKKKEVRCSKDIPETVYSERLRTSFVGAVTKQKLTPVAAEEEDMDMLPNLGNFLPFPGQCHRS